MRVVSFPSFSPGFMSLMTSRNRDVEASWLGMLPCSAGELLQRASGVQRPRALNFFERRDHNFSQLPTRPPCPREKHNRFLVGNSRQSLHYAARRFLEQMSLQMPQRLNAAHSSEGAGGCDDDFVVRIINH